MKLRILFIENQAYDMEIYSNPFEEDENYELETAYDIYQARDFVQGENLKRFDLVILDVMMPPGDLYNMAETNKGLLTGLCFFDEYFEKKPSRKPVPVILLTAAAGDTLKKIRDYNRTKPQIINLLNKSNSSPMDLKVFVDEWAESS